MCVVGMCGLRGWNTSDTPHATHALPASSGRCAVADAGIVVPSTCEKPMPACSNTLPSRRIRVRPPPPSARVHASSTKRAPPSIASTSAQMRSCSPRSQCSTGAMSSMSLFRQGKWEIGNGKSGQPRDCRSRPCRFPIPHFPFSGPFQLTRASRRSLRIRRAQRVPTAPTNTIADSASNAGSRRHDHASSAAHSTCGMPKWRASCSTRARW